MNRNRIFVIASLAFGCLASAPAVAGTYAKVDQATWQQGVTGLPTYVNMYSYMPSTLATKPPVLVYLHHCSGDAASSHQSQGAVEKIADTNGFIIIYPEATGENCWDAGSTRSLKHGGGGDTGAIVQMVRFVISKYSADPNRVYVAGDSSGGIMTEAILGVYPDVFMAGVSIMGVPCGCWADGYNDVTGKPSNGTGQWSGTCAGGSVSKTGQAWGDLVRSYFPGYKGHRPRLQQWHGDADSTLSYKNVAEDIKEWTNVLELSATPTATEANTPKSGTTHQYWKNSCFTVYETFVLAGVGHAVSADATLMTKYFGLDKKDGDDPETAACGATAVPGGASGAGGAGGSTGTGTGGTTGGGGGGMAAAWAAVAARPAPGPAAAAPKGVRARPPRRAAPPARVADRSPAAARTVVVPTAAPAVAAAPAAAPLRPAAVAAPARGRAEVPATAEAAAAAAAAVPKRALAEAPVRAAVALPPRPRQAAPAPALRARPAAAPPADVRSAARAKAPPSPCSRWQFLVSFFAVSVGSS
jgi:acetylxylan esterase